MSAPFIRHTLFTCVVTFLLSGCARQPFPSDQASSQAPIPVAEQALPTQSATPWFKASLSDTVLEGASFDRQGNLVFADVVSGRVMRLSAARQLTTVATFNEGHPGGTAVHRDGRIFVAVIADQYTRGWIVAMRPDGSDQQLILGPNKGFVPNDLVFDAQGGFYFSDFRGSATDPAGGVYYMAPNSQTPIPVLQHLALANGVALSPDGKTLWVTEYGRNLLYRIKLANVTETLPLGIAVPYRFTGPGPDSMRTDSKGNVYVAMMEQGRVMVFGPNGVPVAQVLLPNRAEGQHLMSASLALAPDAREMVIVAGGGPAGEGAWLFQAMSLAPGLRLFSHR